MDKKIIKVDNPVYMTKDEIKEKYDGYQVLVTNIVEGHGTWIGGIVQYFAADSRHELQLKLNEYGNDEVVDYGIGGVFYLGPIPLNPYAGGGLSK